MPCNRNIIQLRNNAGAEGVLNAQCRENTCILENISSVSLSELNWEGDIRLLVMLDYKKENKIALLSITCQFMSGYEPG
jgi:hypothetical protein